MIPKSTHYQNIGDGRDTYIMTNNGGLFPAHRTIETEKVSSFATKSNFTRNLAHLHSKPIIYMNDGCGRDTYVSDYSGGLRPLHQAGHGSRTFYN